MMRDIRSSPFAWQHREALDVLAVAYDGQSRITAIGVYTVITWLASEQRTPDHLSAYLEVIAERCGISAVTVRRYLHRFEELGILRIEHHQISHKVHDRNTYYLIDPPKRGTLAGDSTPVSDDSSRFTGPRRAPLAEDSTPLADERVPHVNKEYEQGDQQQQAEELLFISDTAAALENWGVTPATAKQLAKRDPDLAVAWLDWLDATKRDERPREPAGFLVAKLRASEEPPKPRQLFGLR